MSNKYRSGSLTVEAIDTFVRVTVANIGGVDAKPRVEVSKKECPSVEYVAGMVMRIRGYWTDDASLQCCCRACDDARKNREAREVL